MKKLFTLVATALTLGLASLTLAGSAVAQSSAPASAPATESAATPATTPAPAGDASAPAATGPTAMAPAPASASPASAASAAAAPVPNKGDVSWMLVATVLVIMMTLPGLALFYGGLVRSKNILSVLMQVFVTFSLISVLWFV